MHHQHTLASSPTDHASPPSYPDFQASLQETSSFLTTTNLQYEKSAQKFEEIAKKLKDI